MTGTGKLLNKMILGAHLPLRLIVVLGMLVSMLGVLVPGVGAASVTGVSFSGGAGTATVGGTLYARQGATLTLTVVTDSSTKCVDVQGAHTARQTSGSSPFVFNFIAGAGEGVRTVTITVGNGNNASGCNGGLQTREASYILDNTGPTVAATVSPAPNGAGWNNSNVTITWSATDAGSGVGSGPTPASDSQTTDTAGTTKSATATDRVGNVGNGSVTVKVDKTAPAIAGSRLPVANADGWNNTDVTVSFSCSDGLSGIKNCAGPATISTSGANQSASGTAIDNAGNSASTTVGGINIDKVAPTLSGAPTTGPNANGWYNGNVTIAWTCSDPLSGIAGSCPANSIISSEGTGLSAGASVSDRAGNTTSATSAPAVKIDKTAPNTTATAPSGWNNNSVTVTLVATDALSGVAATYYTIDGGAQQSGTSIDISAEGIHTLQFWSVDNAGNTEAAKTVQIKIDRTPPTISHTQSPAANADGWNNGLVTVTFACGDSLSGVASCTAPQTVATEGKNQPVTGTATDNAGNTATDPATVSIDTTKPTITAAPDRAPNGNGWYRDDVTVGFTCADALSGIKLCSGSVLIGEGANQSASGTATDAAGNSASTSASGINVDKTAPSLAGAPMTAPNANGWYGGDVTIRWTCSDALSGIDGACPPDSVITGEGDKLSVSAKVCDRAGNCTITTVSDIKIDRAIPSTTGVVAGSLVSGWYTGAVTVTLTGVDGLSGVDRTYYSVDGGSAQLYAGSFSFSAGGAHTITFWSVDKAGNSEDALAPGHSLTIKIDNLPPTISGAPTTAPNANGWYSGSVEVIFTCADAETGIATCVGGTIIAGPGKDLSVTGTATDAAGNTANVTVGGINIDIAAPTLKGEPTSSPNAAGWYRGDVTIRWVGADELSGIDPNTQPGNSIITGEGGNLGIGPVTISDRAGNSASASVSGIKIDRTAPTITGQTVNDDGTPRSPNGAGWFNSAVRVHFTCADTLSGVQECASDVVLSGDGANQSVTGTATDLADNSASATVGGIKIDSKPPTTDADLQCTGQNAYCRGTKAKVVLSATDQAGLSGVKEIRYKVGNASWQSAAGSTASIDINLNGSGKAAVLFYAVDNAGNSEVQRGVEVKYDTIAPTVTHTLNPAANADGWNNANVTVHFTAIDDSDGSGVDPKTVTPDQVVNTETPANGVIVTGQAYDLAGNLGTDSVTVKVDKTAPAISGAPTTQPNGNRWYRGPVTVHFTCSDALSGVASCPADQTVTTEGANQTVSGTAIDKAGNTATYTVSGINIDTSEPTITGKATTASNRHGWYNGPVTIRFTCNDAISGVQECTADVTLTGAGANQSVTGMVVDKAGNAATYTVTGINIDLQAPTLSGAPTTAQNAAGWYNTDVAIHWTGTDDLSGIDPETQPANSIITGEGDNLGVTATISDKAGNQGTGAVGGIKIDRTAPIISGAPTTQPNGNGWYNGPVMVSFTCSDNLSGVASCPGAQVIAQDGAAQSVTSGKASDNAGNSSLGLTVGGINIDTQLPQSSGALSCTPNNGWCRGQTATVVLTASDQLGLSGVQEIHYRINGGPDQIAVGASVSVDVPLAAGSGQATIAFRAVDRAGNGEQEQALSINFDNAAPTVTAALNPQPNAAGWNNTSVTVHFNAIDDAGGSGVDPATVTPDQTVSAETAGQVIGGQATDRAGNVGNGTVTVKVDKTKPIISGAPTTQPNGNGWYNGPVTVHFTCSDGLSGVAVCPSDVTLTANGAGQAVTGMATDKAGNTASVTVSDINIDTTGPVVAIGGVADGGTYTLGAVPTPSCTATDPLSGLSAPCTTTLSGGAANGVGTFTYTATATDKAGNTTTAKVTYKVIYRWDGFLQPINDTAHQVGQGVSIFKGGSTVPVKFQLKRADGTVIQANSLPQWLTPAKGSATTAPVDESIYSDPATSGTTYRWDTQQYIYNWSTKGSATGYFYRIGVTLDDGQTYFVNIGLR